MVNKTGVRREEVASGQHVLFRRLIDGMSKYGFNLLCARDIRLYRFSVTDLLVYSFDVAKEKVILNRLLQNQKVALSRVKRDKATF